MAKNGEIFDFEQERRVFIRDPTVPNMCFYAVLWRLESYSRPQSPRKPIKMAKISWKFSKILTPKWGTFVPPKCRGVVTSYPYDYKRGPLRGSVMLDMYDGLVRFSRVSNKATYYVVAL